MQLGLRPRLKARPSLVDLLRRSHQQEQQQQHLLESHSELVDGAAASSHSPPQGQAPLSAHAANQELPPVSLALEAQRIASTYQLPCSPSKLRPLPSTQPPLSLDTVLQQQQQQPDLPSYSHNHESQHDGPAAEPTASPKMAPVSSAHVPNLPHRRQAPRRACCICLLPATPRHRQELRANFTSSRCRNMQQKMASTRVRTKDTEF